MMRCYAPFLILNGMERIIRTLKDMRKDSERSFINNSITVHNSKGIDCAIPDAQADLEMIIELNQAISTLENSLMAKEVAVNGA